MEMTRRRFAAVAAAASSAVAVAAPANPPARLRRKDSYFGFHFDLHPNDKDTALGRDVTEAMIAKVLDRTKPDYIQYDCKGHVGWLGYPSKVSPSAPGMVKDSLALWRKVTAEKGVALYIHFSGVWDSLAVATYPKWARVDAKGKVDDRITSTFGPYVDERMIPQLREVATKYDLDGAWVDGECWATGPDYGAAAAKAFGSPLPKTSKDPKWHEFLEFNRAQFRRYLRHYLNALHESNPGFQVASNWLYTTYVPEKPDLPVDFVSGDYLGNASISTARMEARYLAAIDKPWDLMAWGFQSPRNATVATTHKAPDQLMQEASVVLMQGGGFQVYYTPTRAGYLDDSLIDTMGSISDFCRTRRAICHQCEVVPHAAVLFSGYSLYHTADKLFGGWPGALQAPMRGMLAALIENHIPVDVLPDWKLEAVDSFSLMVVPDWADIGAPVRDALTAWVARGGTLLIVGAENAGLFGGILGAEAQGAAKDEVAWLPGPQMPGTIRGKWQELRVESAQVIGERFPTADFRPGLGVPAATVATHGKGHIACIWGPAGFGFDATHSSALRGWIGSIVRKVWDSPLNTSAPPTVEMAIKRRNGKTILHMANMTGMQVAAEYITEDFIPAVGPFDVSLKMAKAPARVTLEPEGVAVRSRFADGVWHGRVEALAIHSALVFD